MNQGNKINSGRILSCYSNLEDSLTKGGVGSGKHKILTSSEIDKKWQVSYNKKKPKWFDHNKHKIITHDGYDRGWAKNLTHARGDHRDRGGDVSRISTRNATPYEEEIY